MTDHTDEKLFSIEKAKSGRAMCKKCKQKCDAGELRIAKHVPNYFSDSGSMKHWYHIDCLFEAFKTQKASTKKIESVDDIDGWDKLTEDQRDEILAKLYNGQIPTSVTKKNSESSKMTSTSKIPKTGSNHRCFRQDSDDNLFQTFCNVCNKIASENSYNMKSDILQCFLIKGTNGKKFEGDIFLWFKLLLPMTIRRIYNLQSKQLIKLFSRVFRTSQQEMLIDLEQGDVSETIRIFFEKSNNFKPKNDNNLTIQEVDKFLDKLSELTKEDDQIESFMEFCKKCNSDNLKMIIRLIKHDLKINAGPRHILDALNNEAYSVFQTSRDLEMVITKFASTISLNERLSESKKEHKSNSAGVQLMFPISPMLAEACKSLEKAIVKNPEGMYSEIKYDGERVQIHKSGNEFRFFTRNLKPVLDHKIVRCKEFIPKAFPSGQDMILDSEIIVVNTETGELLPFGTLGVHKREQFVNSEVCLFVFDCVYYNGEDLTKRTLKERKKILEDNIKPIKNHVQLSEYYLIKTKKELATMTAKVLKAGLEGLVLKNIKSFYQPGKRGWLKIKKDYLFEGQMADTADLVVLGGWYGTGRKGGMLSIFLMGSYDIENKLWKTVTKVSGLNDTQMDNIQKQLIPLLERSNPDHLPKWLSCKRQLIPDLIAIDPIEMPVWEISGAEFTKSEVHTANGISIRFPRITRIRNDKSPKEATNVEELELLVASSSKDNINIEMLFKDLNDDNSKDVTIQTKLYNGIVIKDENFIDLNDDSKGKEYIVKLEKRKSDEIDESLKNNKKIKRESKTTITSNKTLSNTCDNNDGIFKNLIVYIKSDAYDNIEKLLKKFINNGGTITENSRLATYVIHLTDENKENNQDIRKYYNSDCRHLNYKWLEDCIFNNKIINQYHEYAVRL